MVTIGYILFGLLILYGLSYLMLTQVFKQNFSG